MELKRINEHVSVSPQISPDDVAAIKAAGLSAGIAMNPDADPRRVLPYLGDVDLVLCMTVFPGFGGQSFIPSVLDSIRLLAAERAKRGAHFRLEVDGGIKVDNIRRVADAGADTFVAGSAIFGKPDYKAVIDQMRAALK